MRVLALTIATVLVTTAHAAGPDAHFEKVLKKLEPVDRLEQLCDYTAMVTIRKDQRKFHPDRAVASALTPPKIAADSSTSSPSTIVTRHSRRGRYSNRPNPGRACGVSSRIA